MAPAQTGRKIVAAALSSGTSYLTVTPAPKGSGSLAPLLGLCFHPLSDDRMLDLAKDAGFTWIRDGGVSWGNDEKSFGSYDWSSHDHMEAALEERGMKWLIILAYGNALYGNKKSVVDNAGRLAFGKYAEATARHFAGHGFRYEIWNEPDGSSFWKVEGAHGEQSGANAEQYALLAKAAAERVHAGDPEAQVSTGGLRQFDYDYFNKMLRSGAAVGCDAVAVHAYWLHGPPETVFDMLPRWESIKQQNSVGSLPNWMTEMGYGPHQDWGGGNLEGNENKYAAWTVRLILSDWAAGFQMISVYDANDRDQGLLNATNKEGYEAIKTLSRFAAERIFTRFTVSGDEASLNALRLEGATDVTYVLWMRDGQKTIQVPAGVSVYDMLGHPVSTSDSGGLTINETAGPIYVTITK